MVAPRDSHLLICRELIASTVAEGGIIGNFKAPAKGVYIHSRAFSSPFSAPGHDEAGVRDTPCIEWACLIHTG
jgi:hypothetical protein